MNTFVRPTTSSGLNNSSLAIDTDDNTFANNKTSGVADSGEFTLASRSDQSVVVAVKIHWVGAGDLGSTKIYTGPASNPKRDLLLSRSGTFTDRTETFYLPTNRRIPMSDVPAFHVDIFGILSSTTFRIRDLQFILADRCSIAACDGAA